MCLSLILNEEHLVNDRCSVFQRKLLKGVCNIASHEVGMGSLASNDHSQCDDADGLFEFEEGLGCHWNFKRTGDPYQIDPRLREVFAQFLDDIIYQAVGIDLVVFRCNDRKFAGLGVQNTGLSRKRLGHCDWIEGGFLAGSSCLM